MEKRIDLTEKELAIGMWLYIKRNISRDDLIIVPHLKDVYLRAYKMLSKWNNTCILCEKYNNVCPKCPLRSCNILDNTLWATVTNTVFDPKTQSYISPFTLQERLEACDKIIKAIENDIPDDYVSPPRY